MSIIYTRPLEWPISWRRSGNPRQSQFGNNGTGVSVGSGRDRLIEELRRLGATEITISSNGHLRRDGTLDGGASSPRDPGAAIYFRLKGEPRVLACDKWINLGDNLLAMAKHIDAIRGQVRWGVGSLEQAFGGYRALPAMEAPRAWWEVLGVKAQAPTNEVEAARLSGLERCHPDRGGRTSDAIDINLAWDEFRRERGLVT
jgi:hypothetical protein